MSGGREGTYISKADKRAKDHAKEEVISDCIMPVVTHAATIALLLMFLNDAVVMCSQTA